MAKINVYLDFNGNCREAFEFYKSIFGGEFLSVNTYADMPPMEGMPPLTPEQQGKILHITLSIGQNTVLMGSDAGIGFAPPANFGNNISLYIDTENRTESDRIYAALSEGGKASMPMEHTFWGAYFGALTDKFGVNWMVSNAEGEQAKS